MSLINDALKKAQQQRADSPATPPANAVPPPPSSATRGPAPVPPAPANTPSPATLVTRAALPVRVQAQPTPVARPVSAPSFRYQATTPKEPVSTKTLWLCLGAIALVLVSVGITLSLTKSSGKPIAVAKHSPAVPELAPAPSLPPQAEVSLPAPTLSVQPITLPAPKAAPVEATPAPAAIVTFPSTTATQPKSAAVPPAQTVATAPTSAAPSVTATPPAPAPATVALPSIYAPRAPTPVNPALRIQNFIDRLRVTGVRVSNTGTKVILGDRLFKVGDVVDSGLELRLVKVEQGVLTFADSNGKTYIKLYQ